ncbi:unnamed protein product [Rotaria sp. Silwood1]|nr:unnamed protein product [Rotaria sp. Silwood1]CAF1369632.1 unnamed protein product [Rotaria sp. Silwood1]
MMSRTSTLDGIYTRGTAQPGLCTSTGCSWKTVGGVRTWVCCCNQDLCNAYIPQACYYCTNCPRPFTRYDRYVSLVDSNTGWCAKMSTTSSPDGFYTRGTAQPGLCNYDGLQYIYSDVSRLPNNELFETIKRT